MPVSIATCRVVDAFYSAPLWLRIKSFTVSTFLTAVRALWRRPIADCLAVAQLGNQQLDDVRVRVVPMSLSFQYIIPTINIATFVGKFY